MFSDILGSALDVLANILSPNGPAMAATLNSYTPTDFSVHFFLQLSLILITCRIVGKLGQKYLGQPQVVGEMIAGVILGPSLFGLLFPVAQEAVFPGPTKSVLYSGAQLGVGLYMFLVGTTLQLEHFRSKAKSAIGVSFAGIAAPFLIAMLITPWLLTFP